jgi:hypothetical protein
VLGILENDGNSHFNRQLRMLFILSNQSPGVHQRLRVIISNTRGQKHQIRSDGLLLDFLQ